MDEARVKAQADLISKRVSDTEWRDLLTEAIITRGRDRSLRHLRETFAEGDLLTAGAVSAEMLEDHILKIAEWEL